MIPKFVYYPKEFLIFFWKLGGSHWKIFSAQCQDRIPKTESLEKNVGSYDGCWIHFRGFKVITHNAWEKNEQQRVGHQKSRQRTVSSLKYFEEVMKYVAFDYWKIICSPSRTQDNAFQKVGVWLTNFVCMPHWCMWGGRWMSV